MGKEKNSLNGEASRKLSISSLFFEKKIPFQIQTYSTLLAEAEGRRKKAE
jgi:hypothetical protein